MEETGILIEVSNDGVTWAELTTLPKNSVSYIHSGLGSAELKYYRAKALGNEMTTSDSEYSSVVSATASFCTEYQDVLDYAVSNSIGVPSFSQNIINDVIIRQLLKMGKWTSFDVFYYFQQETGTPYEFMTLNWRNPTNFRLLNAGANNVSFVGGSGFKVAGSNNQYFNTQFNPFLHSVNYLSGNSSVIFSVFDQPATFSNVVRYFGAASAATNQTSSFQAVSGQISVKHYEPSDGLSYDFVQADVNSHRQSSQLGTLKRLFINGASIDSETIVEPTGVVNTNMYLFATHYVGANEPSEGEVGLKYFALGSALLYNDRDIYKILNQTYTFENSSPNGSIGFTTASSALPSLYFPQIARASKFPTISTSKKYIVLYSTDHANDTSGVSAPENGAICWGECDHLNLDGFIERGVIIAGYGSETPNLELSPDDPDGETVHLYYHPGTPHPDSGGIQQTRLLTRTGGSLSSPGWTDRGKVLGVTSYETEHPTVHTGYLVTFPQEDGTFVGVHVTKGWDSSTPDGVSKVGVSTSPTGRTWTRVNEDIGGRSFMPYFRQFHINRAFFFVRNGIQYALGCNTLLNFDFTQTYIGISQCDGNYNLVSFLGNISTEGSGNGCTNAGFYIDEDNVDVLHIYYVMNKTSLYYTTYDLTNLD